MAPPTTSGPDRHTRRSVSYYDPEGSAKLSTVVAHALADHMNRNVTHTERLLYRSVDPASLNRLFARRDDGGGRHDGHATFTVEDYAVTIAATGRIEIASVSTGSDD